MLMQISCQEPWTVPVMPASEENSSLEVNRKALRSALVECIDVFGGVSMDRLLAKGKIVDRGVANLKEDTGVVQQLVTTRSTAVVSGIVESSLAVKEKSESAVRNS